MSSVMLLQDYGLIAVPSRSARHGGADHRVDSVSQSGQNLGSLDVGSAEIWGNLGDFGCYIISFFGKKLGSLDGTYIGIYRGPTAIHSDVHRKEIGVVYCSPQVTTSV